MIIWERSAVQDAILSEGSEGMDESEDMSCSPREDRTNQDAIRKAMNLLLYRNRTEKELTERLQKEAFSEEAVEAAIAYVKSFGYLNDARYAESYCMSAGNRKSRSALRSELKRKGVEDSLIENALEYVETDETAMVTELLNKRYGEPHRMDEAERRRAYGYLGRRGFSMSDIRKGMEAYQAEAE